MICKVYYSKWESIFNSSTNTGKFVIQWIALEDEGGGLKSAFTGPIVLYHDLSQVLEHAKTIAQNSFKIPGLPLELVEAPDVIQVNGVTPFSSPSDAPTAEEPSESN